MPLRGGGSDQGEVILLMAQDRHLGQHPAPAVEEIAQRHPPDLGERPCDPPQQPLRSARSRKRETREPRQIEHAHMVTHRRDLLTNPHRPRALPIPCLGRCF